MNAEQVVQEQVISEIVVPQIVSASADISPIPNIPVAQPVAQMPIPQVIAPQPIVPIPATQPLPQGNFDKYIDRITTLVADGKYNKEQIIGGLAKKVGQDKAVELYNLVTRVNSIPAF